VFGLDLDTVRNVALVVVVVAVLLAAVTAFVVKAVVGKVVTIVVLGGLAVLVWSQRQTLQDCADRVGATLGAGAVDDTTCTFFGRDVTITAPLGD
jgi:protein-S-isoprenylcysteine O-methyltransferase Ste14